MVQRDISTNDSSVVVLLSGGMDSLACAHLFMSQGRSVRGIFINYGQAALTREREASQASAKHLAIPLFEINAKGGETFLPGELTGRNAFFITAAMFLGGVNEGLIALGIHSGTPYYDCSPSFLQLMQRLAEEQTDGRVSISAPFVEWNKSQIYQYLLSTNLPIEDTYSCEAGTLPTCGTCASCKDRQVLQC